MFRNPVGKNSTAFAGPAGQNFGFYATCGDPIEGIGITAPGGHRRRLVPAGPRPIHRAHGRPRPAHHDTCDGCVPLYPTTTEYGCFIQESWSGISVCGHNGTVLPLRRAARRRRHRRRCHRRRHRPGRPLPKYVTLVLSRRPTHVWAAWMLHFYSFPSPPRPPAVTTRCFPWRTSVPPPERPPAFHAGGWLWNGEPYPLDSIRATARMDAAARATAVPGAGAASRGRLCWFVLFPADGH